MFVPSQNLHAEALAPDGMAFGGGISESNSIWLRIGGQGPLDRISALISRKRDQSPPNPPPHSVSPSLEDTAVKQPFAIQEVGQADT